MIYLYSDSIFSDYAQQLALGMPDIFQYYFAYRHATHTFDMPHAKRSYKRYEMELTGPSCSFFEVTKVFVAVPPMHLLTQSWLLF